MKPIHAPPNSDIHSKNILKPYYVPGLAVLEPGNPAVDMTSKLPALMRLTVRRIRR